MNDNNKKNLWKTIAIMATIIAGLVSTVYAFQVGRISDHEERLRSLEKCIIENTTTLKNIANNQREIKHLIRELGAK